jgi:Nucleotidyl transferase AbiEii toxin, Type IV TA system
MPKCFEPHSEILPAAQREIWPHLKAATELSFVLYGGTAVALYLGHRVSVDFDFFSTEPLDKAKLRAVLPVLAGAATLQDEVDTLAASVPMPSGPVRLAFFGGIGFGRVSDPLQTADGVMLVASPHDLLATKLKATLDRAQARDYRDIAALLRLGLSLPAGIAAFKSMFNGEPAAVLRALGFFKDGDLASLDQADRATLTQARDRVAELPPIAIRARTLSIPTGACDEIVTFRGGMSLKALLAGAPLEGIDLERDQDFGRHVEP